jgi:prepilin-type N-terminal cleavage/methylation domain-containing protein
VVAGNNYRVSTIAAKCYIWFGTSIKKTAMTLIEILVVISIIGVLMAVIVPSLSKARYHCKNLQKQNNIHQILLAVDLYSTDNNGDYPESVATIGTKEKYWNWQDPRMMTGYDSLYPGGKRAMSSYLFSYIPNAKVMYCPCAPSIYKYYEQAWSDAEKWSNPETPQLLDPVMGNYCFYWNYLCFLTEKNTVFRGPVNNIASNRHSKLLISDYFGYDHWRSPDQFGSCQKFADSRIEAETWVSADYWAAGWDCAINDIKLTLHAGYIDGHVESYTAQDTEPMKVSITPDGSEPYCDGMGPGVFFIPKKALP